MQIWEVVQQGQKVQVSRWNGSGWLHRRIFDGEQLRDQLARVGLGCFRRSHEVIHLTAWSSQAWKPEEQHIEGDTEQKNKQEQIEQIQLVLTVPYTSLHPKASRLQHWPTLTSPCLLHMQKVLSTFLHIQDWTTWRARHLPWGIREKVQPWVPFGPRCDMLPASPVSSWKEELQGSAQGTKVEGSEAASACSKTNRGNHAAWGRLRCNFIALTPLPNYISL